VAVLISLQGLALKNSSQKKKKERKKEKKRLVE
jgi:hypothetical protein